MGVQRRGQLPQRYIPSFQRATHPLSVDDGESYCLSDDGEGKSCLEVAGLLLPTANDTEKNMLANEVMNGYNSYVRGKATRGSEEVSEQFNNGSTALSKSKC